MRLSAESHHLLQKRLNQALEPVEIFAGAVIATLSFACVYFCCCFSLRYSDASIVVTSVIAFAALAAAMSALAALRFRTHKPSRAWIVAALGVWGGLACGYELGDRYWYQSTSSYYNYRDMASYVNIDPFADKGQAFMDAGTIYFKEGSHVQKSKAVAFRNGLTYCVAPIVRTPLDREAGSNAPETMSGVVLPRSGTVDFWAVGINCCGKSGDSFRCGDVRSPLARSGLRVLDEASRSMYLLAVQEWSASTGLPVRHPVFFSWTTDPVMLAESTYREAWNEYWVSIAICFMVALVGAFALHAGLQVWRVI